MMHVTSMDPAVPRDETLAKAALTDGQAFSELYERYFTPIYGFMCAQTRDVATAEDLTSQVFFRALISAGTFRGEGSYRAWIFQIARNTLATWRAKQKPGQVSIEELPDVPDDAPSPPVLTLVDEERSVLWDAVDALPHAQREVVHLRYETGLSVEEIARRTRRSGVAVRQLLHRARAALRTNIDRRDAVAILGTTGTSALIALAYRRHRRNAK